MPSRAIYAWLMKLSITTFVVTWITFTSVCYFKYVLPDMSAKAKRNTHLHFFSEQTNTIQLPHITVYEDSNLNYTEQFKIDKLNYSKMNTLAKAKGFAAYDTSGIAYNCINQIECPLIFTDRKDTSLFVQITETNKPLILNMLSRLDARLKLVDNQYQQWSSSYCSTCIDVLIPTVPRKGENTGKMILTQIQNFKKLNSIFARHGYNFSFRAKFINMRRFKNPGFYWMRQFYNKDAIFLDAYTEYDFKSSFEIPWYRPWGQYPNTRYTHNSKLLVKQTLDFIKLFEIQNKHCNKYFFLLEDDFLFCTNHTSRKLWLRFINEFLKLEGEFRAVKISYGAGGIFIPCALLPDLIAHLKAYVGSWPIDALLASFLLDQHDATKQKYLPYIVYRYILAEHMEQSRFRSTLGRDPGAHASVSFAQCNHDNTKNAGQLELERFPQACKKNVDGLTGDFALVVCRKGLNLVQNMFCRRWFKTWSDLSCVSEEELLHLKVKAIVEYTTLP